MNYIFSEVEVFLLSNTDFLPIDRVVNLALYGNPLRALY